MISQTKIANASFVTDDNVADLFNRIYGNVFLYTSRQALEGRLHDFESTLRSIYMIEGANRASQIQGNFRNLILTERVDYLFYVVTNIDVLYHNYMESLRTTDLDYILTSRAELQNFLFQHETHVMFDMSVLEQIFAPLLLELPPDDVNYLQSRIRTLRSEIEMAPGYDIGGVPRGLPTQGGVSSGFGFRYDPINGAPSWHSGIDISAPTGTPVYAWFNGEVRMAAFSGGWGQQITTVQDSIMVRYAHLSEMYVIPGQRVSQGDLIGRVGTTGRSTGPHLHLGLYINGIPVDPYLIISGR